MLPLEISILYQHVLKSSSFHFNPLYDPQSHTYFFYLVFLCIVFTFEFFHIENGYVPIHLESMSYLVLRMTFRVQTQILKNIIIIYLPCLKVTKSKIVFSINTLGTLRKLGKIHAQIDKSIDRLASFSLNMVSIPRTLCT